MTTPFDLASLLSSPTLLLHHPPSQKIFTLHRSLLASTNLLLSPSTVLRRQTTLTLLSSIHLFPLERTLEFLYTRRYTGDPPITTPSLPQASKTPREENPLIAAAAQGRIGVWGGAPPVVVLGQKYGRKLSSYESEHVELEMGWVNDYAIITTEDEELAEGKDAWLKRSLSTASTIVGGGEFGYYEPELNFKVEGEREVEAEGKRRVRRHLEVYELAKGWEVVGLKEAVLEVVGKEVRERRELVGELVRGVYGGKERDEELRQWVVGVVAGDWKVFGGEEEVKTLIREGGEFVVDLVGRVKAF